ncbi:PA14 domain-containing protein [Halobacillus hunanensis]|uniref:PA14 domain-containing protein n=1 Tax=Halobacillus hunanensis TaxID=578214 RepID=UPI0009A6C9EA|nr:PA14 domain-containing protein [Halobacillus hunanensis]
MIVSKLKLNMKVSLFLALIIILIPLMGKPVQAAESNWSGAFYNNRSLTGTPIPASYESLYFNWGYNSPKKGVNANNFSAKFQKQVTTDGKTGYFLHTYADDGIRLSVDGQEKIDRWEPSSGEMDKVLLPSLNSGSHTITSEYFEASGTANYFSFMRPFGEWVAYHYNNASLSGKPIAAESIKPKKTSTLSFDHGYGSPHSQIDNNNFSSRYVSAVYLPEGEYVIRMKADDGARVYIDDKEIIDKWYPSSYGEKAIKVTITDHNKNPDNIHWLRVDYFEETGISKMDFTIEPVKEAASLESWMAFYYKNESFKGTSDVYGGSNSLVSIPSLDLDWRYKSPDSSIPNNGFSASFLKLIEGKQDYFLQTYADDNVRATINNELIINRWDNSWATTKSGIITGLQEGTHLLQVDYLEKRGRAEIMADIAPFGEWIAYYYNNSSLKGKPADKEVIDGDGKRLNLNYKMGSPSSNVPKDNFSAVFTTVKRMKPGKYIIDRDADDGLRVYIDGELVVNDWRASNFGNTKSNVITINNRKNVKSSEKDVHTIRIEYFEKTGASKIDFNILSIKEASSSNKWLTTLYNNQNLSGPGKVSRSKEINFNWGYGGPKSISKDSFSASFYKLIDGREDYFLQTYADDSLRATVGGKKVIDRWDDSWGEINHEIITGTSSNNQLLQIDYAEKSGRAEVVADIAPLGDWIAFHYNNTNLEGMPTAREKLSNLNRKLSFDFDKGSPVDDIQNDNFSSLYTSSQRIEAGPYLLRLKADDGVRVYIDDKLVVDRWGPGNFNSQIAKDLMIKDKDNVSSNQKDIHTIRVEYMESEGASSLDFKLLKPIEDVPYDSWLGLYYPNKNLSGMPLVVGGKSSQEEMLNRVSFDWGTASPLSQLPRDEFSVEYIKNLSGNREYFVNAFADDGLKVSVNDNMIIDEWHDSSGESYKALLTELSAGQNTVKVQYYENTGAAFIHSNVVPFGEWSVSYYPNTNLKGKPAATKVLQSANGIGFSEKLGLGSPTLGVPSNNYSANYITAKRLEPGEYLIDTKADDDIQVLIDGKVVVDSKTAKQENKVKVNIKNSDNGNIHWIEVRHKEYYGESNIEFSMSKFNKSEFVTNDDWLAEYYPNIINPNSPKSATGLTQLAREESLELNWNEGSPHKKIPVNEFSAVYQKLEYFSESGQYDFQVSADDGVIVKVDGEIIINSWVTSNSGIRKKENYPISKGSHLIEVIYFEKSGRADIKFNYKASETKEITEKYKEYSLTLDQMVNAQMSVNPQTDKRYEVYIREDALNFTSDSQAVIKGSGWRVRGGPGTNYWIVGTVSSGQKVTIYSKAPAKDGTNYDWYEISYGAGGWVDASPADTRYYLNPDNFDDSFQSKLQFLDLSESANVNVDEVNNKILEGKGILEGKAQSFVTAGKVYGVNEVYLIAHALLETGNGYSGLATGMEYNGKTVYNMYGIGAYDNCALECGAKYAYEAGWFTPEEAIIGGADFIGNGYVDRGQDTLYKMRWNPDAVEKYGYPSHQYATDVGWAAKQVYRMNNVYSMLESYSIKLEIPRYK